jgi:glycosyltransferase involved in cell wall biosynthesis
MTLQQHTSDGGLVIVSKSTWEPPIRREHAFARLAVEHGFRVWFVERPLDLRAAFARDSRRHLLAGLAGRRRPDAPVRESIRLVRTATPVPAHRSAMAEGLAAAFLRRDLARVIARASPTAVIATAPWQWPAVRALGGVRRIFEGADDWRALLPARHERMEALYRRIAAEADAVILVSPSLRTLFAPRAVTVVPNGVSDDVLAPPARPPPNARRLVYIGTLSPRFDAPLVADVLRRLPRWKLDLYGPCQYPGRGDLPGAELRSLLDAFAHRVTWHGVVPRSGVACAIDRADVALLPNRAAFVGGQDSMKLYDYAARGRPIVATAGAADLGDAVGVRHAAGPDALARAIIDAATEPASARASRRAWTADQRWSVRWPDWSAAVLGTR